MIKLLRYIAFLYMLLTITVGLQAGETESSESQIDKTELYELAKQLLQSHRDNQFIPLISENHSDLSIEKAYMVQRYYVDKRLANEKPAGFKAGITSLALQKKFNITQPVTGVLFGSGDLSTAKSIKLSQFKRLTLEMEIGFEIGKTITKAIANQAELKQYIKAVFPVIELPDFGVAGDLTTITMVDIIAVNGGAEAFIKGKPISNFAELDFNTLKITLTRDEEIVDTVQNKNALGNQWQIALWTVNSLVAREWTLEPGQFVITGSLGKIIHAEPGNYIADFGKLGQISFFVVL